MCVCAGAPGRVEKRGGGRGGRGECNSNVLLAVSLNAHFQGVPGAEGDSVGAGEEWEGGFVVEGEEEGAGGSVEVGSEVGEEVEGHKKNFTTDNANFIQHFTLLYTVYILVYRVSLF